jgi:hypothetical protein
MNQKFGFTKINVVKLFKLIVSGITIYLPSTQWAAVITQSCAITDPPHMCEPPEALIDRRATWWGNSYGVASIPFIILDVIPRGLLKTRELASSEATTALKTTKTQIKRMNNVEIYAFSK